VLVETSRKGSKRALVESQMPFSKESGVVPLVFHVLSEECFTKRDSKRNVGSYHSRLRPEPIRVATRLRARMESSRPLHERVRHDMCFLVSRWNSALLIKRAVRVSMCARAAENVLCEWELKTSVIEIRYQSTIALRGRAQRTMSDDLVGEQMGWT